MKRFSILIVSCILMLYCKGQGINFIRPSTWAGVLHQSKTENKYIFIDGYATWCKPCKMMDEKVYPRESVGKIMNNKFISIRVQTDQSAEDDDYIKSWYKDAALLTKKYKLNALPSLLFLSPNGELLYRAEGFLDEKKFIALATVAIDPKSREVFSKVEDYKKGKKNYQELSDLADVVSGILLNDSLAMVMRKDYVDHINKLAKTEQILTHKNLEFAFENLWLINSANKLVVELRKHPASFSDSLMNWPGGTVGFLSNIVRKDELDWKICRGSKILNSKPDWTKLEREIAKKYPQINAKQTISDFQIYGSELNNKGFFYRVEDWKGLNRYFDEDIKGKLNRYDLSGINNICWWYYFCPVTDRESLELAVTWMDSVLVRVGTDNKMSVDEITGWIDTKAALLYKQGQRKAAIATEQKAVALKQEDNLRKGQPKDAGCGGFNQSLERMKKGEKLGSGYPSIPVSYPPDWKLLD